MKRLRRGSVRGEAERWREEEERAGSDEPERWKRWGEERTRRRRGRVGEERGARETENRVAPREMSERGEEEAGRAEER
ncbi:hypothetical protein NHX12_012139 [Muraenolepis orangiensis]|uniref:Uncharacterized protein n=1 Tax=Muraenolepis orangiensis TaxID=630683 RepID=A0A9Q0DHT7_9TELE|nr:hypothetical protein NHX12_012139 [Muraenolepis orangiensis]